VDNMHDAGNPRNQPPQRTFDQDNKKTSSAGARRQRAAAYEPVITNEEQLRIEN